MTKDLFSGFSEDQKRQIVNSVDQCIFPGPIHSNSFRPFGEKPRLRKYSSGKWVNTNTCSTWGTRFEWDIAIDWMMRENGACQ